MGSKDKDEQLISYPPIPLKVRLFIWMLSFFVDLSSRPNLTMNRTLLNLLDLKSPCNNKLTKNRRVRSSDVTVDSATNLWFRIFLPDDDQQNGNTPVVIYFHGGGFICLAPNSQPYHDLCTRLAMELRAIVISVNYRLAPEHKYPAQYDDALQVLTFLDQHSSTILPPNADLRKTFLAGDSAGANIAHHLAVKLSNGHEFVKQEINILGVMAIQAFFQSEEPTESEKVLTNVPVVNMKRVEWACKAFLPEGADKDHPSLNVLKELKEVKKYPATIVIMGGYDPLKDRQKMYYEELKRSGKEAYLVEYENAFHTFYAFPEVPESWAMIGELRDFMMKEIEKVSGC